MAQKEAKVKKELLVRLKTLIVDNDPTSRLMLRKMFALLGNPDIVVTGKEAAEAFQSALNEGKAHELICFNISEKESRETIKQIRKIEMEKGIHSLDGVKIIMTTSFESQNDISTFKSGCEGYLKKPVDEKKLLNLLKTLSFDKKTLKKNN